MSSCSLLESPSWYPPQETSPVSWASLQLHTVNPVTHPMNKGEPTTFSPTWSAASSPRQPSMHTPATLQARPTLLSQRHERQIFVGQCQHTIAGKTASQAHTEPCAEREAVSRDSRCRLGPRTDTAGPGAFVRAGLAPGLQGHPLRSEKQEGNYHQLGTGIPTVVQQIKEPT